MSHLISHSLASPVRIFTAQKVSQFASVCSTAGPGDKTECVCSTVCIQLMHEILSTICAKQCAFHSSCHCQNCQEHMNKWRREPHTQHQASPPPWKGTLAATCIFVPPFKLICHNISHSPLRSPNLILLPQPQPQGACCCWGQRGIPLPFQ